MIGASTRFAFKVLSATFNHDFDEVAVDPSRLMYVLENAMKREQFNEGKQDTNPTLIKYRLAPRDPEFIGHKNKKAYRY